MCIVGARRPQKAVAQIRFGKRTIKLPQSRRSRIALGTGLVLAGGLGGWLPVLGFWMVPLGLVVLSVDIPSVRRRRRKAAVKLLGWWRGRKGRGETERAEPGEKPPLRDSSLVP
jgi:hypothetical protein